MTTFQLFSQVILANDLPNTIFKRGDVATIVETIEGKNDKPNGYILEIFDWQGNTLDVVAVLETDLLQPKKRAVLSFRELELVA
jgi:Domain of unknown function (DUF4926)